VTANFRELATRLQTLVRQPVTLKTIAGNSIAVWFGVSSSAPDARGIWIEPPWRIETESGVESSSAGFPDEREDGESESAYRQRFDDACARSDCLRDARLVALHVDLITGDLALRFSNGRTLRSFTTESDWECWHFADHAAGRIDRVIGTKVRAEIAGA